ncbi:MAG: SpoIID/LytB domain-containing protein [Muribaculaceae bacterium]|nr:SpoIID/LytB domain-containing protein [Muribaculaceae bacterium]
MEVRVGIKTEGEPILRKDGEFIVLENMLIGDGFHWERTIRAILSGKVELLKIGKSKDKKDTEENEHNQFQSEDRISLINSLPLETYLECVVGSEMNPSAPIEFLKAHAVISRSWVLGKILNIHFCDSEGHINTEDRLIGWDDTGIHRRFHVCSDDHCQRYQGLQPVHPTSLKAIQDTADEILISDKGNVIDARFSKCCGGVTELFSTCWQPVELDYIKSFNDPWCDLSGLSLQSRRLLLSGVLKDYDLSTPGYGYRWETEITKAEIESNLRKKFGRDIGKLLKVIPLHRGPSRRIDLIRLEGTQSSLDIGKELWIRRLLSPNHLYSSAFDIEDLGDKLKLHGSGWGHGVGLCQIGAANMAAKGASYEEILTFYYPGARLIKNPKFQPSGI